MTDTAVEPGAWVPRLGDSRIPTGHAELIRGLYRLAAWVADHPDLPAPHVQASVLADSEQGWDAECRLVDRVALALGVAPAYRAGGDHYTAASHFGPVGVSSTAITPESMDRYRATWSYRDRVQPEPGTDAVDEAATVAGGAR